MKVSREKAAENRAKIVETASRLFRERGVDAVAVAEVMQGAGLTHGGFYGHFPSKDGLVAEACGAALEQSAGKWRGHAAAAPDSPVDAIVSHYLSVRHRDAPGRGCALSALAGDAARGEPELKDAFAGGLEGLVEVLIEAGQDRGAALATLSAMVGAVALSRAVGDDTLSREILQATAAELRRKG